MAKLHQALISVRDDYTKALTAAEARGPSFDNAAFWKSPQGSCPVRLDMVPEQVRAHQVVYQ
jgi:hypothetical protein